MQLSFLLILALLTGTGLLGSSYAVAQQAPASYQWATSSYSTQAFGNATAVSTAISPLNGDVFTIQGYSGQAYIAGQFFSQQNKIVLTRQNAAGTLLGVLLEAESSFLPRVLTDARGNVYATGTCRGRLVSGNDTIIAAPGQPLGFVAKWSATGTLQWLKRIQLHAVQSYWYMPDLLAVGAAGHVTLAGSVDDYISMTIDTTRIVPASWLNNAVFRAMFCAQFDGATGNLRWARISPTTNSSAAPVTMAADPATGDLVLSGLYLGGSVPFEWDGHVIGQAQAQLFWLRLNQLGEYQASFVSELQSNGQLVAPAGNGDSFLAFQSRVSSSSSVTTLNGASILMQPANDEHIVVARIAPSGRVQWVRGLGVDYDDSTYVNVRALAAAAPTSQPTLSGSGGSDCYLAGRYVTSGQRSWTAGSAILPPTHRDEGNGYVLALDGLTGAPRWATPAAAGPQESGVASLGAAPSGELVVVGTSYESDTVRFAGTAPLVYPPQTYGNSFVAKLVQHYNQIQGTAFTDNNFNGQQDATEAGFAGLIVECQPEGSFFATEATGAYSAITQLGTHTVGLAAPPPYYTLPTSPAPAAFASFGNIAAGRDFPLQPIPNQQDVQAFVTPINRARPGFALRYRVTYRNIGTTTLSGTVAVQFDPRVTYLGNFGGGTVSGGVLTVAYAALAPQQSRSFDIQFQVPTTVPAGTVLVTAATIEPVATDRTPADNTETNRLTVTASFDPNDITVNWSRLTPNQVTSREWLEYTIRFENTGTDTAFSVLLRDSLPGAQLDLGTLQFVAASHNCVYRLAPSGLLVVQFTSIRLPYRNINALGSMGFVRFRVRPRGTLSLGDVVPNRAAIHFDYNAPITTNTALTVVQSPQGSSEDNVAALKVRVWPNPASHLLNMEADTDLPALTLLDALGRSVRTLAPPAGRTTQLDVRGLPAGFYLLRSPTWAQRGIVR
ncbi:MAG: T9SS type A sorting domain-containing protein [Hymenobacteraceae bacterium]|nr:T9SS type A sorting domain-containing protein [Hymenobacteraceae bacterium]